MSFLKKLPKFVYALIGVFILIIIGNIALLSICIKGDITPMSAIYITYTAISWLLWLVFSAVLIVRHFKNKHARILKEAITDDNTGLPGSKSLYQNYYTLPENGNGFAFIYLYIEEYENLVNVFDYRATNHMLNMVGRIIKAFSDDLNGMAAYRFSGQFLLLLPLKIPPQELQAKIKTLTDSISGISISDENNEYSTTCMCKAGIYVFDGSPTDLDYACSSMQKRLEKGYDNCSILSTEIIENLNYKNQLLSEIPTALLKNEFIPYFQCKYDIATRRIVGAEIFVRWQHPTKGLIFPNKFINVMEENGTILDLDMYMLEYACKQIKQWIDAEIVPIPLSINLSQRSVLKSNFIKRISELTEKYSVPANLLEFELSQNRICENLSQLMDTANKLHALGFILSLDDFSLSGSAVKVLQDLPLDVVKLDSLYYKDEFTDSKNIIILSNIINLLNQLDVMLIAEGVETGEQAEMLKDLGCPYAQGYLFSKPVALEDFEKQIADDV